MKNLNKSYFNIANSSFMLLLCSLAILFVMFQSFLFFKVSYKRALEIGYTREDLRKIIKGSAIFSIVPSLPIIISYMLLLPILGNFFPWLRLSVIGSASYETMVANMAVTSFGYENIGSANFSSEVFVSIMWILTLGMMVSSLSVLVLKKYDQKLKEISSKSEKGGFGSLIAPIMFLGMMATFSAPYMTNFSNPIALIALATSASLMLIFQKFSMKYKALKEFSFSLSMILGMMSASIFTVIIGG